MKGKRQLGAQTDSYLAQRNGKEGPPASADLRRGGMVGGKGVAGRGKGGMGVGWGGGSELSREQNQPCISVQFNSIDLLQLSCRGETSDWDPLGNDRNKTVR